MGRLLQCNSSFFLLFMKVKIISLECVCNAILSQNVRCMVFITLADKKEKYLKPEVQVQY